jgi:4-amino-4-deoxy-L-arabinose transferase-like glycosyltransferase
LAFVAVAVIAALGARSTSADPARGGGRHNLSMAYNLWKYGVVTHSPADRPDIEPSWRREPLYSVLLAGVLAASADPERTTHACLTRAQPPCQPLLRRLKLLNAVVFAALCGCTLWAARGLLGGGPWPWVAFALIALNGAFWSVLDRMKTEPLAALELLVACAFLQRAVARPAKPGLALAAGAALGALILTKAIFFYLGPVLLAAAALHAWRSSRWVWIPVVLAVAVAYAIAGVWVVRNVRVGAGVRISQDRSVLAIRAEYDTMGWREYAISWLFFLQENGGPGRSLLERRFEPEDYFALSPHDPQGYLNRAKKRTGVVARRTGSEHPTEDEMYDAAKSVMLERWPMHLALTGPFAVRGIFVSERLWRWRPPALLLRWATNALIPALLTASALLAWRRDFGALWFFLVPLYSYGLHSLMTHNNVKYSWPLAPAGAIALALLLSLLVRRVLPAATRTPAAAAPAGT